jgi:hypothetical protein
MFVVFQKDDFKKFNIDKFKEFANIENLKMSTFLSQFLFSVETIEDIFEYEVPFVYNVEHNYIVAIKTNDWIVDMANGRRYLYFGTGFHVIHANDENGEKLITFVSIIDTNLAKNKNRRFKLEYDNENVKFEIQYQRQLKIENILNELDE